ncbi:hypothetical protein ARMSODRAFT_920603 [Armillaria solidipes]|uniref:Uncharacterized protein n=1 Tax=Armillaria solidipes TaxID=1076256 RepID=A0A2H3BGL2_9AGAR|nr:hypothetical protein ARMSODRAFT_920603 [Armillaria solidipes]
MARDPYKTDESASLLWFEQAVNATVHIGAIAYGTQLATAFLAVYYVLHSEKKKYVWQSITYVVLLVLLSTIYTACNIHSNEMAWIDERGYPGGPLYYQREQNNTATIVVANVAAITITFLADICMLWRCYILYRGLWIAVVLPALLLLSSTIMGVFLVLQLALPGAAIWKPGIAKFSIPYWALSIAFTLLVTLMIVARVLLMRRRIQVTLGPEYGRAYTGIAAMLIECALPYALISFVFIILYGLGSTASNLFVPLMIMVEAITPQLIIIRVVRGRGLSADAVATTSGQISVMQFHKGVPPSTETTELPDSPMIPLGKNVHAMNIAGSLSDSSFEELSKASPR